MFLLILTLYYYIYIKEVDILLANYLISIGKFDQFISIYKINNNHLAIFKNFHIYKK